MGIMPNPAQKNKPFFKKKLKNNKKSGSNKMLTALKKAGLPIFWLASTQEARLLLKGLFYARRHAVKIAQSLENKDLKRFDERIEKDGLRIKFIYNDNAPAGSPPDFFIIQSITGDESAQNFKQWAFEYAPLSAALKINASALLKITALILSTAGRVLYKAGGVEKAPASALNFEILWRNGVEFGAVDSPARASAAFNLILPLLKSAAFCAWREDKNKRRDNEIKPARLFEKVEIIKRDTKNAVRGGRGLLTLTKNKAVLAAVFQSAMPMALNAVKDLNASDFLAYFESAFYQRAAKKADVKMGVEKLFTTAHFENWQKHRHGGRVIKAVQKKLEKFKRVLKITDAPPPASGVEKGALKPRAFLKTGRIILSKCAVIMGETVKRAVVFIKNAAQKAHNRATNDFLKGGGQTLAQKEKPPTSAHYAYFYALPSGAGGLA